MMEIFWTMLASQDRKRIREYIAEQNLMAAIELDERIGYSASSLAGQPYKGRNGRVEGTRELVIHPHLFWFMRSIASGEKCISCVYCILHRSGHRGAVGV
ncbi:type II toxin-antitoxin system RelE/ParE family toxin [Salmonella enterica]|nr:type II toxin-antitoxin system RelE/ParE family toxin [Salmonella enterica]